MTRTKHNRRSIRLPGFDYSTPGAYFITICTRNRQHLFGNVIDGKMILNPAGRMVETIWNEIPQYYGVNIDAFQIMPNHIHGIIIIPTVRADPRVCPNNDPRACPKNGPRTRPYGQAPVPAPSNNQPHFPRLRYQAHYFNGIWYIHSDNGQPRGGCPNSHGGLPQQYHEGLPQQPREVAQRSRGVVNNH